MADFEREETVICSVIAADTAGNNVNVLTSMNIVITDSTGTAVVNDTGMNCTDAGIYHYDYTSNSTAVLGRYDVLYIAIDEGRTFMQRDVFHMLK